MKLLEPYLSTRHSPSDGARAAVDVILPPQSSLMPLSSFAFRRAIRSLMQFALLPVPTDGTENPRDSGSTAPALCRLLAAVPYIAVVLQ